MTLDLPTTIGIIGLVFLAWVGCNVWVQADERREEFSTKGAGSAEQASPITK